jgi:hypothetical protein
MLCSFLHAGRQCFRKMLLVLALFVLVLHASSSDPDIPPTSCDFEVPCVWQWNTTTQHGFRLVAAQKAGHPPTDANNNTLGE